MISEAQIREQLLSYLTREISLNEFEDWLALQSWNMQRDSSPAARRLVGAIELRFAEYSNDHLTDEGLERELKGLISPVVTVYLGDAAPTDVIWTGTTASESSQADISVLQAA